MKKILFALLLMTSNLMAKEVAEQMQVIQLNWSQEKQMYRLTMQKHAAAYWAPKKLEKCLLGSMNQRKEVKLSFDTKNLIVTACQ